MEKKISIIIPVYNAQMYLKRCIDSILNQSYSNFELILVNDGSTDRSGVICDEYAKKDKRIKVRHIENSGPAVARNVGLTMISGSYLTFADADDQIINDSYSKLVKELEEYDVEMIISSWRISKESNIYDIVLDDEILSAKEIFGLISFNDEKYGGGYPWNKLINLEKIKNKLPQFNSLLYVYEDKIWILELLKHINNVKLTKIISYNYYVYNSSLSHSSEKLYEKMENTLYALEIILQLLKDENNNYINEFYKIYYASIIDFNFRAIKEKRKLKPAFLLNNKNKLKLMLKDYNFKIKIKYYLVCLFLKIHL